jgi:Homing endonuclease associated repeat
VTKEELTTAIAACARKLEKPPTLDELMEANVSRREIRKHFGTYQSALEECGLESHRGGKKVSMEKLFMDWVEVVRRLHKIPTVTDYEQQGKYSVRPLIRIFGSWSNIPDGIKFYAMEHGLAAEYKDVLEEIDQWASRQRDAYRTPTTTCGAKVLTDRPTYGLRIEDCPLVFAPVNEQGVVYLFGALSERLGFLVLRVQTEFPDCEAMRVVEGNRMQPVKIEFEFESRNFLRHAHEPTGCDLIVCWEHNWPESPLEVVELKGAVMGEIGKSGHRDIG